ncbi:MAG: histidine kinase, partial [Bryobacteraceae bacterium]
VCQAQYGRLVMFEPDAKVCQSKSAVGPDFPAAGFNPIPLTSEVRRKLSHTRYILAGKTGDQVILDQRLNARCRSYWSIPLLSQSRMVGVIQLGFTTERSWLPRELHLVDTAVEQCLQAAEKARLVEDLAQREEQVRELSEHMWQVEEEERRRISRELHDDAGQSLLFIRLQLEMTEKTVGNSPEILAKLRETRDVVEKTIIEIRRVIAALSPAVLEQLGLVAALRQLVKRFRRVFGGRVRLHSPKFGRLPRNTEIITYRLVQECFNNVAKHSGASAVNIHLSSTDNYLELRVEDDGVGFEVEAALEKRTSFGLSGMIERVALLGGHLGIRSVPGKGTTISVVLPIRRETGVRSAKS